MNGDNDIYAMPNMGCLVGTAYQAMTGRLNECLKREKLGITVAEYMVLRALYSTDGLQMCQLSDMLGKDRAAICRTVATMAHKGLVRTEPVSHKCVRCCLAPAGTALKPKVLEIAQHQQQALEERFTPEELAIFRRMLRTIINED